MAKPEWGIKRICQSCSAPFYDLRRDPIVCPKCEAVFDPESVLKSRRTRGPASEPKKKPPVKVAVKVEAPVDDETKAAVADADVDGVEKAIAEEAGDLVEADADDEDVPEDTSDLGNDEEVAKVVDTSEKKDET